MSSRDVCLICLEDTYPKLFSDISQCGKCNYLYHPLCLKQSIEYSKYLCPTCRRPKPSWEDLYILRIYVMLGSIGEWFIERDNSILVLVGILLNITNTIIFAPYILLCIGIYLQSSLAILFLFLTCINFLTFYHLALR